MRDTFVIYYAAIVVATVGFLSVVMPNDRPRPTATDCSVVEFAPDMSARDREVCRQLRQHRHRM